MQSLKPVVVLLVLFVPLCILGDEVVQEGAEKNHDLNGLVLPSRVLWEFGICPAKSVKADVPQYYANFAFWAGAVTGKDKYAVSASGREWCPVPGTSKELKANIPAMKLAQSGQFCDDTESKGHNPLGLVIQCDTYGFDQKGFVLYRYTATLKDGADALTGVYLGLLVDADVPNAEGKLTPEDDALEMPTQGNGLIFWDGESKKDTDGALGIVYVGSSKPIISSWKRDAEPVKDKDQYMALAGQAGFEKAGTGAGDWRFLISDGPYDLGPGQTVSFTVAVGFARGADKLDLELKRAGEITASYLPATMLAKSVAAPRFGERLLSGPRALMLYPAYPNPFNNTTLIRYDLPDECRVDAAIYNMRGRRVATLANEQIPMGSHQLHWSGTDDHGDEVSSGVYFLVLRVGEKVLRQKLILMK